MGGFPKPGGVGGVSSVDTKTGAVVLSGDYLSMKGGTPVPYNPVTIGAVNFTPDISTSPRVDVTTTANPTAITMPAVVGSKYCVFILVLYMDAIGGYGEPPWDAKITWIGIHSTRQQGANKWDEYQFETKDGGTTWNGWHITANFSVGANYVDWTKIATPAQPAANNVRQFVATADKVMKVIDDAGEIHLQEIHVGTAAPTNTAIPWIDTN